MNLSFDDAQEALRDAARGFLAEHSSSERVRQAMVSERGWLPDVWRRIGEEMGWPALLVPEEYGGLGLGAVELVALMEEMGAALLCSPFFASVCLGGTALQIGGSEAQREEHLPGIAAGTTVATVAHTEANGRWGADAITATARPEAGGFVLDGVKTFVPDGASADLLLIAARHPGSTGETGVRLDGVRVAREALLGEGDAEGWPVLSQTLDLALIALAAEQVGGAQRCLDLSVEYAKQRIQFGRPIGSFQAIKHKCADLLVEVESARSASYYAGAACAAGDPEVPVLASLAKAVCSDAYFRCAADAIQIHGGVGFTWELDCHLYFKRAKSSETLLGDATFHRERVAQRIGL